MENSATKIQAFVRGFFQRKRNQEAQEATVTVVKWLKQYKLLDEEASVSTLELPEELRVIAVEALDAEINKGPTVEASGRQNEEADESVALSATLEQRKKVFEHKAGDRSSASGATEDASAAASPPKKAHAPMLTERMAASCARDNPPPLSATSPDILIMPIGPLS